MKNSFIARKQFEEQLCSEVYSDSCQTFTIKFLSENS